MDKKTILVVDDEKDVLSVLERRLTVAGYTVITADNGNDAIILAKSKRPDLIILDIIMPGMDGGEVAGRLREIPQTKDIPVVYLTCLFTKKEVDEEGHVVAGNVFVAKPYKIDELLKEIRKLV
jgi:CheY-like chemotaxis protein